MMEFWKTNASDHADQLQAQAARIEALEAERDRAVALCGKHLQDLVAARKENERLRKLLSLVNTSVEMLNEIPLELNEAIQCELSPRAALPHP